MYNRILLGIFTSLGLVNLLHKIDTRVFVHIRKQHEQIIRNKRKGWRTKGTWWYHDSPHISYPQITLDDNFLAYFNGILRSYGALRTGVISSP